MLLSAYPSSFELAGQRTLTVLLNCYLREYAEPRGAVRPASELECHAAPHALRRLQATGHRLLRLDFPRSDKSCLLAVEPRRANYRFRSQPYLLNGRVLDWRAMARQIVEELGEGLDAPGNAELLEQIENSFERLQQFYAHPPQPTGERPVDWFLLGEQSLTSGHSHHPAPKSRQGMDDEELFQYSPELQARFRVFFFRAAPGLCMERSVRTDLDLQSELAVCAGVDGGGLLPVHPWQAKVLLQNPAVQRLIRSGRLEPLGCLGQTFSATSSVRTLFSEDFPYFLKLSLHMRLTNCLRKNAWYELESALLLERVMSELDAPFPEFSVLAEPAYCTLDYGEGNTEERLFLREAFSTLWRDGQPVIDSPDPLVMAAALFGGNSPEGAVHALLPNAEQQRDWFAGLCRSLLWPVLYYYAEHGVIFEPHLQNTVLRLRAGQPHGWLYRDLEGTKLLASRWADRLPAGTVTDSVLYTEEQAWQRFAYCLIFNQLWEVIDRLDAVPADELWNEVRLCLQQYLQGHGSARSLPLVERLLGTEQLPLKANLTTRFLQRRDRDAAYVLVPNPLRGVAGLSGGTLRC